jgi:hypothetical protein
MDDMLNIWSMVEYILAQNISRQRDAPGDSVERFFPEDLYDFEFKVVILEHTLFKLKTTIIKKTHRGWSKLVVDTDALVMFADGFEDIVPAHGGNRGQCRGWQRILKSRTI